MKLSSHGSRVATRVGVASGLFSQVWGPRIAAGLCKLQSVKLRRYRTQPVLKEPTLNAKIVKICESFHLTSHLLENQGLRRGRVCFLIAGLVF